MRSGQTRQIVIALLVALSLSSVVHCAHAASVDTTWEEAIDAGEKAYKDGHNKIAEDCFDSALKEAEKFSPADARLATTLNDLAVIYDESGRFEKAEGCYTRALTIEEKAYGAESTEVATTVNNLANLYKDKSDFEKAEPLYKRAMTVYTKTKGPKSEFLAMAYHNLAVLYEKQGRDREAIEAYKTALSIGDETLGPDNDHMIDLVGNLAMLYDKAGEKDHARPYFKRYLNSVKETLKLKGSDASTLNALKDFAAAIKKEGQNGNAELLEKAVQYESQSQSSMSAK